MPKNTAVQIGSVPVVTAWPTALTTGTTGALTTNSAAMSISTNGATYSNVDFTNLTQRVQVYAENVSFTNCRFRNGLAFYNTQSGSASYCEMNGDGVYFSSSSNVVIDHCKVIDWDQDAFHVSTDGGPPICTNIQITNCYIYHSIPEPGHHADGIQIRGSDGLQFMNNYVDFAKVYDSANDNACIYIEDNYSTGDGPWLNYNVNIVGNYMKGGGYTAYLSNGTGNFSNNTLASATGAPDGYYYPGVAAGITGTGNVKAEDGSPLPLH
jgi:hypothetical protein